MSTLLKILRIVGGIFTGVFRITIINNFIYFRKRSRRRWKSYNKGFRQQRLEKKKRDE